MSVAVTSPAAFAVAERLIGGLYGQVGPDEGVGEGPGPVGVHGIEHAPETKLNPEGQDVDAGVVVGPD